MALFFLEDLWVSTPLGGCHIIYLHYIHKMQLGSSNEIILWLGVTRSVLKSGSIRKVENH